MAKLQMFSFTISLMFFYIGTINSAVQPGYFYDNPIKPFNSVPFTPLRSTGQFSNIPFGQKVETNTQTRLTVPPIPTLPPLTTYIPKQTTRYNSAYGRVQSSTPTIANNYNTSPQIQQVQGQGLSLSPQQLQQNTQFQRPQQQIVQFQSTSAPYSYPKPQIPVNTLLTNNQQFSSYTPQLQTNVPQQSTNKAPIPTQQFYQNTTPTLSIQRQTPRTSIPSPVVPQQVAPTSAVSNPTSSVINTESNPTQTSPDIYVVDGRQLKQYKVYEHIDNDIDQEVHNFLPANFFLSTYHSMIGDTHPLGEDLQVQNRASSFQQRSQQIPQPTPNTIALGSGGLGFVKLPNGNVYLGSGSLGYISSLQHLQDVQDLRSRTDSSAPDPLHFGHGSLSDSFYYRNQKD